VLRFNDSAWSKSISSSDVRAGNRAARIPPREGREHQGSGGGNTGAVSGAEPRPPVGVLRAAADPDHRPLPRLRSGHAGVRRATVHPGDRVHRLAHRRLHYLPALLGVARDPGALPQPVHAVGAGPDASHSTQPGTAGPDADAAAGGASARGASGSAPRLTLDEFEVCGLEVDGITTQYLGEETVAHDLGFSDASLTQTLQVSHEQSVQVLLDLSRTTTVSGQGSVSFLRLAQAQASVQRSLLERRSYTKSSKLTISNSATFTIPARTHVLVTVSWKLRWELGRVLLGTGGEPIAKVPYRMTVGLRFGTKLTDVVRPPGDS
jgi:hypothetical protein